ncbi:N-acetylneuraminate synthase family protein [Adlercreutzia sp. ZJ242]|uniref:N-acetylneuraminate synthase family protein n=1 Tax=Adlercreutzia sp. ZJ242 TaxID=2709409 RepID=UPI0013ECAE34|nr:N-acetylneuraminate synthase family protein [Adlercreutzia sp. ZJ242]
MNTLVDRIESGEFTLIAEVGVNYYDIATQRGISNMEAAKLMCLEARDAGVHAVKFQTYKAETLAAAASPSYWDTSEEPTTSQRELFKKYDSFGEAEYREIAAYCAEIGIDFCSTAFDFESADYLDPLMDVYKISSSDLTNHPFIEHQARKGKPIIMSVGAGDLDEMRAAVDVVRSVSDAPIVLCHCVLEYPTPFAHANLRRISSLKLEFPGLIIGYSDHCRPDICADVIKSAYVLGAHVIEKHFTLDKTLPGNDHYHAMDPDDARRIIEGVTFVEKLLGSPELGFSETEAAARLNARRSIVSAVDIPAGMRIAREMLSFKRPGTGISPQDIDKVIGQMTSMDIPEDTIMDWDLLA